METLKELNTITELSTLLGFTTQTIRNNLDKMGLLSTKHGKSYVVTKEQALFFIAKFYPKYYNVLIDNDDSLKERGTTGMTRLSIPTTKGKIQQVSRKGKTYYYIYKLPIAFTGNGEELIYYKSKGFTTKKEAEKERQRVIKARASGQYIDEYKNIPASDEEKTKEPTYYEFCLDWLKDKNLEYKTFEDYQKIIESKIKPYFSNTPMSGLNAPMLQDFFNAQKTNIPKLSTIVKQSLRKAKLYGYIKENYHKDIEQPKSKHLKEEKKAMTREQVKLFLDYFKGHRLEHAIHLIFNTGLREGEALALKWNEIEIVNDTKGIVHVNSSYGKTEIGYARKSTKNQYSIRKVPFYNPYLIKLLKDAKERSKSEWVIENRQGTNPIDPQNFSKRYFKAVAKQLGFTFNVTSHHARMNFVSHLMNSNKVSISRVAELVGHRNIEMVMRCYTKYIKDKEDKALEELGCIYA